MYKKRLLVGMCSWDNPELLKITVDSLLECMDLSKDGIAVVLNEADIESIKYLLDLKIPFVAVPENRGELAIDYLLPFAQNAEYFMNSNDDMVFCGNFADDLIEIIEKHYPCSASCRLVENFNSNNVSVTVDETLKDFFSEESRNQFKEKSENGFYDQKYKIQAYCHPIMVKCSDLFKVGGYSGWWDMDFFSGYGRDDIFPYFLYTLHSNNFRFVTSKKSHVFHASSATNKKKPKNRRSCNHGAFLKKTGLTIPQFRTEMKIGLIIEDHDMDLGELELFRLERD